MRFARSRWFVGEDQAARAELFIGAEGRRRPPREILGTALHEAVHGLAMTRDIIEVSDGRYHNKRFAALAREMGITVDKADKIGWSATSVPAATAESYAAQLAALEAALDTWRHTEYEVILQSMNIPIRLPGGEAEDTEQTTPDVPPSTGKGAKRGYMGAIDGRGGHRGGGNYLAVTCGCQPPRRLRAARSVLEQAPITCGACGADFAPAS